MTYMGGEHTRRVVLETDLFCGKCGYNLRTLSIFGRCPECGNEYDARPIRMEGLLLGQDIGFPFEEILGAVLCGLVGVPILLHGTMDMGRGWYAAAAPFVIMLVAFVYGVIRKLGKLLCYRSLVRTAGQQVTRRPEPTSATPAGDYALPCDTLCAKCEFNLIEHLVCDRCPKCGNRYDARPHVWRGVFTPGLVRFPLPGVVTSAGCGLLGAWLLAGGVGRDAWWWLLLGLLVVAAAMVVGGRTFFLLQRFVRHRMRGRADEKHPGNA